MKILNSKINYWPIIIVLLFYLLIATLYLANFNWNFNVFSIFGYESDVSKFLKGSILLSADKTGYDGQFFYLIALNPWDISNIDNLINMPVWRYQRIIYPFAGYLFSGLGRPALLPFVLPLINLVAILASCFFLIEILKIYGIKPYFCLFYGLFAGIFFPFLYNLAEILAYFFVIVSLYLFLKNRIFRSVIFLSLAALTKEVTLFVAAGFIIYFLIGQKDNFLKKIFYYSLPIVFFSIWWVFLHLIFSKSGFLSSADFNIGLPFAGLIIKLKLLLTQPAFYIFADGLFYLLIIFSGIYIIFDVFKNYNLYNIMALSFFGFALTYSTPLLFFPKEYFRHFLGFFLFLLLSYLPTKSRIVLMLLFGFLFSSLFYLIDTFLFFHFFR